MQALADGTATAWRDELLLETYEPVGRGIRTQRWKYAVGAPGLNRRQHGRSDRYIETHLCDLENDPHERRNLVSEPSLEEVRATLRERLIQRTSEIGEPEPTIVPAELRLRCDSGVRRSELHETAERLRGGCNHCGGA